MKVSALKRKERVKYGIITPEILEAIFSRRMLTAAVLAKSTDLQEAFMSFIVLQTLTGVYEDLEGLME